MQIFHDPIFMPSTVEREVSFAPCGCPEKVFRIYFLRHLNIAYFTFFLSFFSFLFFFFFLSFFLEFY